MTHAELLAAIAVLPTRQQHVMLLRYGKGLIWSEVAGRMKISEIEAQALGDAALEALGLPQEEARTSAWGDL